MFVIELQNNSKLEIISINETYKDNKTQLIINFSGIKYGVEEIGEYFIPENIQTIKVYLKDSEEVLDIITGYKNITHIFKNFHLSADENQLVVISVGLEK